MGHGRQHVIVPSIEGTGAQNRPVVSTEVSAQIRQPWDIECSLTACLGAELVEL